MNIVKFVVIWLFITILCIAFESYVVYIFNYFDAGIGYIFSGPIGSAVKQIIGFIGNIFDTIMTNPEAHYITSTGVDIGNIVWIGTFAKISFLLLLISLFWGLVFRK